MEVKRILLVEDNPDDEMLAWRALTKSKIASEMVVAHDGAEALDYLFGPHNHPMPQVILLDLKLPKVTGLEVLQRIKSDARTRLTPVVMLTSSLEERDVLESYRLGANSYIVKPVDFEQFVDALRQLGQYWLLLNQLPGQ